MKMHHQKNVILNRQSTTELFERKQPKNTKKRLGLCYKCHDTSTTLENYAFSLAQFNIRIYSQK